MAACSCPNPGTEKESTGGIAEKCFIQKNMHALWGRKARQGVVSEFLVFVRSTVKAILSDKTDVPAKQKPKDIKARKLSLRLKRKLPMPMPPTWWPPPLLQVSYRVIVSSHREGYGTDRHTVASAEFRFQAQTSKKQSNHRNERRLAALHALHAQSVFHRHRSRQGACRQRDVDFQKPLVFHDPCRP